MKREGDFHVENIEKTERSHDDICVLLLDSDATGLMNMSEILCKRGFRVVATTKADDLPRIINNEKIDLVLAEFRLVEMNKFELLDKLKTLCETPVIDAGEYVKYTTNFYCMYRGARFYLKNPFTGSYSENLWQFKVWRLDEDFLSQIDSNPPEEKYSVPHTQSIGNELKQDNLNNEVKTKDLDEYKGDYSQLVDQKKPELMGLEMQNEFRQTDDEHSKGNKRKERADTEKDYGSDLGDQKKPKLICADDIGIETFEAFLSIEEADNGRKEPKETKNNEEGSEKEKPEPVCMEDILERWSTQPFTDFAACVIYEFEELDFQPLESVGEIVVHHEIPLSPCESSNKEAIGQLQMQNPQRALDEELMEDGISLADLDFDLQEGQSSFSGLNFDLQEEQSSFSGLNFDLQERQGSTSDLELLDKIYSDLAKELKP